MKKLWILFILFSPALTFSQPYNSTSVDRIIDFYLVYPLARLDNGYERRQTGTAGFGLNYQWYFSEHLGVSMNPNAWIIPARLNGQKSTISAVSFEVGLSGRPAPNSYFDPVLGVLGGVSRAAAQGTIGGSLMYPAAARFGFNLYRNMQKFSDTSLALHAFGDARYYFSGISAFNPLYFDFGLAFRGSF